MDKDKLLGTRAASLRERIEEHRRSLTGLLVDKIRSEVRKGRGTSVDIRTEIKGATSQTGTSWEFKPPAETVSLFIPQHLWHNLKSPPEHFADTTVTDILRWRSRFFRSGKPDIGMAERILDKLKAEGSKRYRNETRAPELQQTVRNHVEKIKRTLGNAATSRVLHCIGNLFRTKWDDKYMNPIAVYVREMVTNRLLERFGK